MTSTSIGTPLVSPVRRAVLNRRSLLQGFGLDSFIEVSSALVVIWQFHSRLPEARERLALKLIDVLFFALAAWITVDSIRHLIGAQQAEVSAVGVGLAAVSVVVMPPLVLTKRRTGRELGLATVVADSDRADDRADDRGAPEMPRWPS
jgi:hypothetical protein